MQMSKDLITALWNSLDFSDIKGTRIMGIWDEFIAKLRIAFETETNFGSIVSKFCGKFNINLRKAEIFEKISALNIPEQHEIFEYIRENIQLIIVEIRLKKEEEKNEKAKN